MNQDKINHTWRNRGGLLGVVKSFSQRNYQTHYERLLKIMDQDKKNFVNSLTKRNNSVKRIATSSTSRSSHQRHQQSQKIKKIFQKSSFARNIFPSDKYFHVVKTSKLCSPGQKNQSFQHQKKLSNQTKKQKNGQIIKSMLIIRIKSSKQFCKTSNFLIQISPFGLRSPVLKHHQLTKDAIGFKFKHFQKQKFQISIFQLRGNHQYLIIKGQSTEDFGKFQVDVQKKIIKKTNKRLLMINYSNNKHEYSNKNENRDATLSTNETLNLNHQNKINQFVNEKFQLKPHFIKNSQISNLQEKSQYLYKLDSQQPQKEQTIVEYKSNRIFIRNKNRRRINMNQNFHKQNMSNEFIINNSSSNIDFNPRIYVSQSDEQSNSPIQMFKSTFMSGKMKKLPVPIFKCKNEQDLIHTFHAINESTADQQLK